MMLNVVVLVLFLGGEVGWVVRAVSLWFFEQSPLCFGDCMFQTRILGCH